MALELERIKGRVFHTLGGHPAGASYSEIANMAGDFLVTLHPWKWLERQAIEINLVKYQPHVRLPRNFPNVPPWQKAPDMRDLIAYDASDSLVNSLTFTSYDHLLELRTYQIQDVSFHWWAAITHLQAPLPNYLLDTRTVDATAAAWSGSNVTTALNNRANARDGEATASLVTDSTGTQELRQDIPAHRLEDGNYIISVEIRNSTATETRVWLRMDGSGIRSSINIDWTGAAPVVTQDITGLVEPTGEVVPRVVGSELLNDGWVRVWINMPYRKTVDTGLLRFTVFPAGSTGVPAAVWVAAPMIERADAYPQASGAPESPSDYHEVIATSDAQRPTGGAPEPVIALWPIPSSDDATGPLSIIYRSGWPYVEDDSDVLEIPDYLNMYFLELCVEIVRGVEEEDNEYLSQRLTSRMVAGNVLLESAMARDYEIQPDLGPVRGGAVSSGRATFDWGINTSVSGPEG